jgi:histidine triad (HIT) family protein
MSESKESCILCQILDGKVPSKKVYEDDEIIVILDVNGANPGHCFVMPKEHYTIMEQVPDHMIGKLFQIANKVSSAVFEALEIKGTNIFVTNGIAAGQMVAHFLINVIPRNDNDGINLQWQPKQLTEEEVSTVELQLKEAFQNTGSFQKTPETPKEAKKPEKETISDDEDYLLKQLRRIP